MKIAWHSICYVDLCEDPERVFGDAQEAGYDGIELMQSFESLGGIDKVAKLCEKYKMPIVCSWGGEIRSRIREGHAVGLQFVPVGGTPQYIAELAAYAKPYGVRLVLHPHIGGQGRGSGEVETYTDCENYLAARPDLWLCPDTAHLTVAGSDPAQVILDMSSKLVYVHLKDWRYSKSYGKGGRYGLGFCELGTGCCTA